MSEASARDDPNPGEKLSEAMNDRDTLSDQAQSPARGVIVVGYTPKPEGLAALERALAEARQRSARLIVVNSAAPGDADDLTERLSRSEIECEIQVPHDGLDPAEMLIAAAEDAAADFIVIGLRRRSPVGKLLLGSNAQRVLLDSSCPVFAVKAL